MKQLQSKTSSNNQFFYSTNDPRIDVLIQTTVTSFRREVSSEND